MYANCKKYPASSGRSLWKCDENILHYIWLIRFFFISFCDDCFVYVSTSSILIGAKMSSESLLQLAYTVGACDADPLRGLRISIKGNSLRLIYRSEFN